jgi:hypothetical protein
MVGKSLPPASIERTFDECIGDYAFKEAAWHPEFQSLAGLEKGPDGSVIRLRSRLL